MTQPPIDVVVDAIRSGATAAHASDDCYVISTIQTTGNRTEIEVVPLRKGAVGAIVDVASISADCFTVDVYVNGDDVPIEIIGPEDVNQTEAGISATSVVEHVFTKIALGELHTERINDTVSYDVQPITDRANAFAYPSKFPRWA